MTSRRFPLSRAARRLGVHPRTLIRWVVNGHPTLGKIRANCVEGRTPQGDRYYLPESEILRIERGTQVETEDATEPPTMTLP